MQCETAKALAPFGNGALIVGSPEGGELRKSGPLAVRDKTRLDECISAPLIPTIYFGLYLCSMNFIVAFVYFAFTIAVDFDNFA